MKSFFKNSSPTLQPGKAGFSVIINNTINICKYHFDKFGNFDISIDVPEINEIFETLIDDSFDYDIQKDYDLNLKRIDHSSNAHVLCDSDKVRLKNVVYQSVFKLKNRNFFELEKNKFIDDKTLAVQIRGTDKKSEISPPVLSNILRHVNHILSNNDITNIFLATDDFYYQDFMEKNYRGLIKYREKTISYNNAPIHFCPSDKRLLINKEVITDVYLLSSSKYFLYSFSNVSYLALTLGINNFKIIDCVNREFF